MNRIQFLKIATICCPVFAASVAGAVVGFESRRENRFKAEYASLTLQARTLEHTIREMSGLAQSQRYAAIPSSPQEQTDFLKQFRGYAGAHQVQIARWSDAPAPGATPATPADAAKKTRPAGVLALASQVDTRGAYSDTREFLYDLLRSPRLFTLNDIKCTRSEGGLTLLSFSLTRYVTPATTTGISK